MNLGLLDEPELHRIHRAFCFCHKVYVLHFVLIESDCPVLLEVFTDAAADEQVYKDYYKSLKI